MQRVTRASAVSVMPIPPVSPGPPGFFTSGDPITGTPATVPGQEWFNGVQEELAGLIEWAGLPLAAGDLAQLRKSIARLAGGNVRTVAANTALTADDAGLVLASAAGGNRSLTLPAAAAANGRPISFMITRADVSANVLAVVAAGSDTIEGANSVALPVRERLRLISDGVGAWYVAASRQADPLIGSSLEWNGIALPPGYLWENGANVSRSTYAALFAVIGTSFGIGDGSTTFGLPDSRGRVAMGRDDMGGSAAGRITAGVSGVTGTTLGTAGGSQAIQAHGHAVNDPGHGHAVNDPGHGHAVNDPGHAHMMVGDVGNWFPNGFGLGAGGAGNVGIGDQGTSGAGTGIWLSGSGTGVWIASNGTGISLQANGAGGSQNVQPSIVKNKIIFTGVF